MPMPCSCRDSNSGWPETFPCIEIRFVVLTVDTFKKNFWLEWGSKITFSIAWKQDIFFPAAYRAKISKVFLTYLLKRLENTTFKKYFLFHYVTWQISTQISSTLYLDMYFWVLYDMNEPSCFLSPIFSISMQKDFLEFFSTPNIIYGHPRFHTFTFLQHRRAEIFVYKVFNNESIILYILLYGNGIFVHCH